MNFRTEKQEIHTETCSNKTFKSQRQRKNLESSKRDMNVLFKGDSLRKFSSTLAGKSSPMDGGAWWAAIYGVAQSRTQLKQLSSLAALRKRLDILAETMEAKGGEMTYLKYLKKEKAHNSIPGKTIIQK